MTHDILLYIKDRHEVLDRALANAFPGREHDVLHLVSLGIISKRRQTRGEFIAFAYVSRKFGAFTNSEAW